MIKEHTKRLGRETADRFANKEAKLYINGEVAQIEKGKVELYAKKFQAAKIENRSDEQENRRTHKLIYRSSNSKTSMEEEVEVSER